MSNTLIVNAMGNRRFVVEADGSPSEIVGAYDLCFIILYALRRGEYVLNADTKRYITASEEVVRQLSRDLFAFQMYEEKARLDQGFKSMLAAAARELLVTQARVGIEILSFREAADCMSAA